MGCKFCKVKHTSVEIREKRKEVKRKVKDAKSSSEVKESRTCSNESFSENGSEDRNKPLSDTSSCLSISTLNEDTESSISKVPSTTSSISSGGSLTRYDPPAIKKPQTPGRGYDADDLEIVDLDEEEDDLKSLTDSSGHIEDSGRPRAAKGQRKPVLQSCVEDFTKDVDAFIAAHSAPTVGTNGKIARPSAARGVRLPCYVPPSQICEDRTRAPVVNNTSNPTQTRTMMTRPHLTVTGLDIPDSAFLKRWMERQKNVSPRSE
ncbi:hypothetical protein FSP39_017579 [Pinctada imbricata]|uniref:Uncharacterized protein n=1 Tax=Pinctada imbricata TaxID=66713 RepID=A0AA88XX17_PINIB|nr:hypothetical protein FSP39_017579 [Pinctada imbricata]